MPHFLKTSVCLVVAAQLLACGAGSGLSAQSAVRGGEAGMARSAPTSVPAGRVRGDAAFEATFSVDTEGEGLLDLPARVPGADWESSGREAATVRMWLDGQYNQDVVLVMGETPHTYRLALGPLKPGVHTLRLERFAPFCAPGLLDIQLDAGTVTVVPPNAPDYDVFANAPILVSRKTPHLTDALLYMYYERHALDGGRSQLKYTPVFTNEDGGTATRALMARWGRTVDIDWAFSQYRGAQGRVEAETYHGFLHFTRTFKGKREGGHPLLQIASTNNIYSDGIDGPLRFRPAPHLQFDPAASAREETIDRHPWAYPLMVKELFRERKSVRDFFNAPALQADAIGDPRRFMFVEFAQRSDGRGVAVGVKLKGLNDVIASNRGDKGLQAERDGWCRVAVELPRAVGLDDIERLEFSGLGGGQAVVTAVRRVMVLNAEFQPTFLPITWEGEGQLRREEDRVTVYGIKPIPPANKPQ
jgi:hypothetical protein